LSNSHLNMTMWFLHVDKYVTTVGVTLNQTFNETTEQKKKISC